MQDKADAMVVASFAADSLALGAHWIYDTGEIDRRFGRVEGLLKPLENSYHTTKDLGGFTHYGDQTLVLLESIAASSGFDIDDFARRWKKLFETYNGYVDKATKATLANFASGKNPEKSGSSSSDMAGAARIAPLAYLYRHDFEKLLSSAKIQTAMTHDNPSIIHVSDFFARVIWKVLEGETPIFAMREVREEHFRQSLLGQWTAEGIESARSDTRSAILKFGQSCDVGHAFPSVVHLIDKYEGNLREALVENVMAGGDSAARGLVVGMILGAHLGFEAIPNDWLSGLKRYQHIVDLLEKIRKAHNP
ncbi:ADP-ribosylglycohydrolase [Syntrophobacter sp. SbD1]|nr:ADP-ribosylglycohydrolase [Syntrophobacter sp. SbD1]